MASGMSGQHFSFHGYLPIKGPERLKKMKSIEHDSKLYQSAHLWIETPYRNSSMLTSLTESLHPHTQLCVAMDLTLESELITRLSIEEWKKLLLSKSPQLPQDLDRRPAVFVLQA
jgi:16S rRNA (cytidine1402-2'-O)-methyltransferase